MKIQKSENFQKVTFSILVSGVTSIQGLSAISFTMHMYTHKLACGVIDTTIACPIEADSLVQN